MKLVIQRVSEAEVKVDDKIIGSIGRGFLILLGIGEGDTEEMVNRYVDKLIKLRIFEDENGKTNLSISDVDGEIMVVSQFTLYANCKKGNRPSFIGAGSPENAQKLYEYFKERVKLVYGRVECGEFGADMKVSLVNDGPFTILWDSAEW